MKLSTCSAKENNIKPNIFNTSCNKVNSNNFDTPCYKVEVDICEDDQMCQPLINYLYKIPSNYICVCNLNKPKSDSCFQIESEKSIRN